MYWLYPSLLSRQAGSLPFSHVLYSQKSRIRQEFPALKSVAPVQLSVYKDLERKSKKCHFSFCGLQNIQFGIFEVWYEATKDLVLTNMKY